LANLLDSEDKFNIIKYYYITILLYYQNQFQLLNIKN